MKLLIKFPTRGRPDQVLPLLERYRDMLSGRHDVCFLITLDVDDPTMQNSVVMKRLNRLSEGRSGISSIVSIGNSKTKIQAVNADMDKAPSDWDVILLASDDMVPQKQGYDAIIFEHMLSHYPDLDGTLWFFDGYTRKVCTLVVMGKPYYERFGYIYHPDYLSLWCDNEWTEVAKKLGKLQYVDCTIIKHEHFANTKTIKADTLYKRNEAFYEQDKALYHLRKKNGFHLGRSGPKTLSILICSLNSRANLLARITGQLNPQIENDNLQSEVEVLISSDDGQKSIGQKRNELVKQASGKWICFVDDDDYVCDSYVRLIMKALRDGDPDCVGLTGEIMWKGTWRKFIHSLRYTKYENLPGPVFVRPPNHLNPVKAEIVRRVKFPEINRGEDTRYAMTLCKAGLIKTEKFIKEVLYFYEPSAKSDREGRK